MSVKERQLAAGRGGEGVSDKAELYDRKKALVLYKKIIQYSLVDPSHTTTKSEAIFPFSVPWEDPLFIFITVAQQRVLLGRS
jgi:hypothetical protein